MAIFCSSTRHPNSDRQDETSQSCRQASPAPGRPGDRHGTRHLYGGCRLAVDVPCQALSELRTHAKIRRLDASRARALPGVLAVLTAGDVTRKRFGFTVQDEEIFPREKVRYLRDVIAAV